MAYAPNLARRPLYLQVCDLLTGRIAGGEWKPGAVLPNELDLARELSVSAGTVRKALDKLEADRLVVRRQGRGTFVVDHASQEMAVRFDRLYHGDGGRIAEHTEVLERTVDRPTEDEQARLKIHAYAAVLRTRRLLKRNGHALVLEVASVAIGQLPGFQPEDCEDCPIATLAQKHGVHLAQASERVSMTPATPEVAQLLRIEPGKMLLKFDRLILSIGFRPVEWRLGLSDAKECIYLATMS